MKHPTGRTPGGTTKVNEVGGVLAIVLLDPGATPVDAPRRTSGTTVPTEPPVDVDGWRLGPLLPGDILWLMDEHIHNTSAKHISNVRQTVLGIAPTRDAGGGEWRTHRFRVMSDEPPVDNTDGKLAEVPVFGELLT